MRDGYRYEVRAEAITMRYQKKRWKEIQVAISQKFGVMPSIRQMQKWFEDYQGTTDDPTGAKYIAKIVEEAADFAKPLAQAKMMGEIMPLWAQLREKHGIDFSDAGWMAMLAYWEAQIGRESFDRIVDGYRAHRDKLGREGRGQQ